MLSIELVLIRIKKLQLPSKRKKPRRKLRRIQVLQFKFLYLLKLRKQNIFNIKKIRQRQRRLRGLSRRRQRLLNKCFPLFCFCFSLFPFYFKFLILHLSTPLTGTSLLYRGTESILGHFFCPTSCKSFSYTSCLFKFNCLVTLLRYLNHGFYVVIQSQHLFVYLLLYLLHTNQ